MLRKDLQLWKKEETEEAQWETFTSVALSLQSAGRPDTHLEALMSRARNIAMRVMELAAFAQKEAWRRDPGVCVAEGSTWYALGALEREASRIENASGELLIYFRDDTGMLQQSYENKSLIWQCM